MKFKVTDELRYMLHLPIRKQTRSPSGRAGEGEMPLNADVSCYPTQGVSLWKEKKTTCVCLDFYCISYS